MDGFPGIEDAAHLAVGDQARLDALASYKILDTPPEPEFDDIVAIACMVCETPVALVSLVQHDRQWFKARVGFAPSETPIGQSVCAHALKEDDLLVIPDLTLDPRTKDNTLVTRHPHIRFYAGTVLKAPSGVPLGTLCVIDSRPRTHGLTAEQAEGLRALGRQTMVMMTMRRAVNERVDALVLEREARRASVERARSIQAERDRWQQEETRLRLAQRAGGIGTFDIDIETDVCFVSAVFCRIFGVEPGKDYTIRQLEDLILHEDRPYASTRQSRVDGTEPREIEYKIRRATDGAIRWIARRTEFHLDAAGMVDRMIGVVQDVTDRKLMETRRLALIQLDDALRDATTVEEVITLTGRTIGEALDVHRAGYCMIDMQGGTLTLERDWAAHGVPGMAGRYPIETFAKTVGQLAFGAPLVVANVPAADWMAADSAWYGDIGTKAKITVPLLDHGKLVGLVFAHSSAPRTWSAGEVDFVQTVADRSFAVVAKIKAEEHQRLLNQELSHRLKNTLSMVQAIAGQTLRSAGDKEAVRAFEDRIIALSRAHDVLLQQSWAAARIDAVVESVLGLHGRLDRFDIAGPNLTMGPKATLSLSLLLHELATNAVKYGALSNDAGRVGLSWRVETEGREPELNLAWTETGGPGTKAPTRRGFGSRLIGMGIAGTGRAKLDFSQEGLRAEFKASLATVAET